MLLQIRSPSGHEMPAVNHMVKWLTGQGFMAYRDGAGNAIGVLEALGDALVQHGAVGGLQG